MSASRSIIRGLGTARPLRRLDREEAMSFALDRTAADERSQRRITTLYRRSTIDARAIGVPMPAHAEPGVKTEPGPANGHPAPAAPFYPPMNAPDERGPSTGARMRAFGRLAPPLAARACADALRAADVAAGSITHLVVASCTGFGAPGLEVDLVERLGLDAGVRRTHVGFMGCHAALNALQIADAAVRADCDARALVCCAELCSLHFQYGEDHAVPNALFADGAAAAVLTAEAHEPAAGRGAFTVRDFAGRVIPGTADAMTWQVLDHGFAMTLSPRVPALIADVLPPWLEGWLGRHGLRMADVGSWAIHAGGPRIVRAVEAAIGRPDAGAASREVLQTCGNMSSGTVLFVLERLRAAEAPRPCVGLAFGPGLVIEGVLLS